QPGPNAAKPQERPAKQPGATKERGATNERAATNEPGAMKERGATKQPAAEKAAKGRKAPASQESAAATGTGVSEQPTGAPKPGTKHQAEQQRKGVKGPTTAAKPSTNPAAAGTNAVSPPSAAGQQNAQANAGAKLKKPAPQQIQQVKSQQANFRAQPKP